MKINCTTTFKEGTDTFHDGDQRTVSDEDGARFVANGWAQEVGGSSQEPADPGEVTLDTHDSDLGQEADHG